MFTKSLKSRHSYAAIFGAVLASAFILSSCEKDEPPIVWNNKVSAYSSEVLDKWMTMQIRLMRNATGIANHAFSRHFAYSGVVAIESLSPGLLGYAQWLRQWNGLTGLPSKGHPKDYYYPANVNAAMAAINRAMFPNASVVDKAAIDSLELAVHNSFSGKAKPEVLTKSVEFGKAVANAVFNWAETDKYKNANDPYTIPSGPGLWKPTPPAMANPATPHWGNNRTIIHRSTENSQLPAPPAYSEDPNSPFYQMVKKVYDVSQTLTDDQKAMAIFWRDVPGVSSPGHWLSIVQQVVKQKNSALDAAALAYALTGAAVNDALIACFKAKYQHNLVRPITYIREVMGHGSWTSFLGTPAHPEYVSAHSALSAAAATVLQNLLGNVGSFTDHTYDYLGFAPRTYSNLIAISVEAGNSRLFAGIHYQGSIDAGLLQGTKVAANILKIHVANGKP